MALLCCATTASLLPTAHEYCAKNVFASFIVIYVMINFPRPFIVSNTENVSGAQTNAERLRPRALPEALEAFVCTFQKLWRLLTIKPRRR